MKHFVAAILILLAGCTSGGNGGNTVIYLAPTLLDEFQTESVAAIESVLGQKGYTVRTLDGQNRADVQLNQLDDALLLNPKAVIVNAVDFDAVVPGVEKVRAAGIPVIAYDRVIASTIVDLTVMAGTVEIGEIAGAEIVRLLTERHGTPRGKVLQILGDPGDSYTLDIQQGFEQVISAYPEVTVLSNAALQWEAANAGDIADDQLLVHPDIDLIFVHAAHLSVPVVASLEAKGKQPGEVMLVSSNGAPVGLDLIRQGWQQVEVEQPLYAQVEGIAAFIDQLIAGEEAVAGAYTILGIEATMTDEHWGHTLRIPGSAIRPDNVDDPRFWGNLTPP